MAWLDAKDEGAELRRAADTGTDLMGMVELPLITILWALSVTPLGHGKKNPNCKKVRGAGLERGWILAWWETMRDWRSVREAGGLTVHKSNPGVRNNMGQSRSLGLSLWLPPADVTRRAAPIEAATRAVE